MGNLGRSPDEEHLYNIIVNRVSSSEIDLV